MAKGTEKADVLKTHLYILKIIVSWRNVMQSVTKDIICISGIKIKCS